MALDSATQLCSLEYSALKESASSRFEARLPLLKVGEKRNINNVLSIAKHGVLESLVLLGALATDVNCETVHTYAELFIRISIQKFISQHHLSSCRVVNPQDGLQLQLLADGQAHTRIKLSIGIDMKTLHNIAVFSLPQVVCLGANGQQLARRLLEFAELHDSLGVTARLALLAGADDAQVAQMIIFSLIESRSAILTLICLGVPVLASATAPTGHSLIWRQLHRARMLRIAQNWLPPAKSPISLLRSYIAISVHHMVVVFGAWLPSHARISSD